jgi:hypothetical protein
MDLRDYVFVGLAVLAAVAFYCNGFYVGAYRSWESLKSFDGEQSEESSAGLDGHRQGRRPKYTVIALFNFQVGPRQRGVGPTEAAQMRNN